MASYLLLTITTRSKVKGPEDSWSDGIMINIRCTVCEALLDEPHCKNAGCPWCIICGPKSMQED